MYTVAAAIWHCSQSKVVAAVVVAFPVAAAAVNLLTTRRKFSHSESLFVA